MRIILDTLDQDGARMLADKIRAFWAKQGLKFNIWTEAMETKASTHSAPKPVFVVRSDIGRYLAPA